MIACYLELYEEGEVEHINGVDLVSQIPQLLVVQKKHFRVRMPSYTAHAHPPA